MSKAFGSLSHSLIIKKLEAYDSAVARSALCDHFLKTDKIE